MPDRRTFLTAALGAAAGCAVAGCSGLPGALGFGDTVKVAVTWSGTELHAFRTVLDGLGVGYELIPLGDDIATALDSPAARRPDVVLLPQPGLVTSHEGELVPLPDDVARQYAPRWQRLLLGEDRLDEPLYGLPFKIAHKSAVWYRKSVFGELDPPRTWSEWLSHNDAIAGRGVAPLALAGADGWCLTDFFENVLLGCDPDAYDRLAGSDRPRLSAEPAVADALRLLGQMWAADGVLAGGLRRSMVQQFADAVVQVFGHRKAAMVVAPDFAEPVVNQFADDPSDVGVFTFPEVDAGHGGRATAPRRPLIVGGDLAVLPRPASARAEDLVRRLAGARAAQPWISRFGGFLSANPAIPELGYSPALRELAADLAGRAGELRFDLSDRLGPLGGPAGLWRVLQDFLARVGGGDGADVAGAVEHALSRLRDLEG